MITLLGMILMVCTAAGPASAISLVPTLQPYSTPIGGPASHNAFPAAVRLADGRLLAVFRSAANHFPSLATGALYRTYSSDGGRSWTAPQRLFLETPGAQQVSRRNQSDPGLMVPTYGPYRGRVIMTYFENFPDHAEARVVVSADESGQSWGTPRNVVVHPGWSSTLVSAPVVQVGSRTFLIAGYGRSGPPEKFSAASRVFGLIDGDRLFYGATAGIAIGGPLDRGDPSFTEPNVVSLGSGRLMALVRTNRWGGTALSIMKSFSADNGRTWSRPVVAFAGEGNPHVIRLRNGTLLATSRHWDGTQHSQLPGTHWAVYRTSRDKGLTWGPEVQLGTSPLKWMAYATPVEITPGRVIVLASLENSETSATINVYRAIEGL